MSLLYIFTGGKALGPATLYSELLQNSPPSTDPSTNSMNSSKNRSAIAFVNDPGISSAPQIPSRLLSVKDNIVEIEYSILLDEESI